MLQHDGDANAARYFYLADRRNSVREIVKSNGCVANCYYFNPFGSCTGSESDENVDNWYGFAGHYSDDEPGGYYCNARNYDLGTGRFTTRDPVKGSYNEPMTLHPYLYCLDNPINATDPSGELLGLIGGTGWGARMRASSLALGGRAMGLAGNIYTAAYIRAVGVNMLAARFLTDAPRFSPDQRALIELAKEARRTGTTRDSAKILMQWASEYGIPFRDDMGKAHWVMEHIHVWLYHIGLLD